MTTARPFGFRTVAFSRGIVLFAAATLAAAVGPRAAIADHGLVRIDRLACQLSTQAQTLSSEIASQYRRTPHYACLARESGQILAIAGQVGPLAAAGRRAELQRDLRTLERLACRVQDEVEHVDDEQHDAGVPRHCRIDTRRARRMAEEIEDLTIDLKDAVDDLPICAPHLPSGGSSWRHPYDRAAPPIYGRPASLEAPPYRSPAGLRPTIQFGARGITFGWGG